MNIITHICACTDVHTHIHICVHISMVRCITVLYVCMLFRGATSANKLTLADLKLIFGLDQKPPASAAAWSLH